MPEVDLGKKSEETLIPPDEFTDVEKQNEATPVESASDIQMSTKPSKEKSEVQTVTWDGPQDPSNPLNWKPSTRWGLTFMTGAMNFVSAFVSAVPSGVGEDIAREFSISTEVVTLTIALFIAGYVVGPLVWGPLSERRGRKFVFVISYIPFTLFQLGCALAQNTETLLICRFLAGVFGAAPQSVAAAIVADLHSSAQRGLAMTIFATTPFAGPAVSPIVSGFISVSGKDWRYVFWISLILGGLCCALIIFVLPETYAPVLLQRKAQKLRKETGDNTYRAPIEINHKKVAPSRLAYDLVVSPFVMLIQEPMLLATSVYSAFVYGVLYLLFEAVPFIFIKNHGWNAGEEGLAFLGLPVGAVLGSISSLLYFNPRYAKAVKKAAPKRPAPELRLENCLWAAPLYVIGFFIIAWTSYPHLVPVGPIIGIVCIGVCCISLFLGLINYTVEVYLPRAATAMSANAVLRSIFGAVFPLFASQMYTALGVPWATSILGFFALLMVPIPYLFTMYGPRLRAASKGAVVYDE